MASDQKAARIFGALFLLTFVTSIAGVLLYGPVLGHKDYVVTGDADTRIAFGALMEIGLVIANVGTAVVLYPIARRYSETLSLAWVASRILESAFIAIGAMSLLAVVTLHRDSTASAGVLIAQGESLVAVHDWTFLFGPGFCVGVGNGLILGFLMLRSGLVPRWMALLGIVAGPLVLIRSVLILFDVVEPSNPLGIIVAPEIVWEAALGFYPLIKGFRTTAGAERGSSGASRPESPPPAFAPA